MIQIMTQSFKYRGTSQACTMASDEIIIISSDEEMEKEDDDVVCISSDDDEISPKCNSEIYKLTTDIKSKFNDGCRNFTSANVSTVKLEFTSDSDEDLPDVDLKMMTIWEATRKECHKTLDSELKNNCDQPSEPVVKILKRPYIIEEKIEKLSDIGSEPLAKLSRGEEGMNMNSFQKEFELTSTKMIEAIQRDLTSSLLVGSLEGGRRHPCSLDYNVCRRTHSVEVAATSTPVYIETVLSTMMEDFHLKNFVSKALYTTVNSSLYLSKILINALIQYLFGSDQEAPTLQDFQVGNAVLMKQLYLHPPCKRGLRSYYLEVCLKWWNHLMDKITSVLHEDPSIHEQDLEKEEESTDVDITSHDKFLDFSDVSRHKKLQRTKMFKSMTKEEKLARLSILLNFFTEIMRNHTMVWMSKHCFDKVAPFRSDISPILSEIMWGKSQLNFGGVNKNVKQLFKLFAQTSKEARLHEHLGEIIASNAAIIQRYERCSYPEMGHLSRDYARELFIHIKSSSELVKIVCNLKPDWLKFHVSAFLLDVEEPANFFKTRERIAQTLHAKNKGWPTDGSFDKEIICLVAIRAMMGIMTMKSSIYHCAPSTLQLVNEDRDCFWFKQMLDRNFIVEQIYHIKKTLSLPCIKGRDNFYFDGFESNFMKD